MAYELRVKDLGRSRLKDTLELDGSTTSGKLPDPRVKGSGIQRLSQSIGSALLGTGQGGKLGDDANTPRYLLTEPRVGLCGSRRCRRDSRLRTTRSRSNVSATRIRGRYAAGSGDSRTSWRS